MFHPCQPNVCPASDMEDTDGIASDSSSSEECVGCCTISKTSLAFILSTADFDAMEQREPEPIDAKVMTAACFATRQRASSSTTTNDKRRGRECRVEGCGKYIINRGLCFRHGGGRTCSADGCQSSAKKNGRCWRHGGSVKCSVDGCNRRGKSRTLCWAHGGGTRCSHEACTKVAVSNGSCWAHGGGKRCLYDGCQRAAYERTHHYCKRHYAQLKDGHEVLEV